MHLFSHPIHTPYCCYSQDYSTPADGKVADLDVPLLGHGWSAAFSFAKCHLEESAPYDNFALFALPIEQFSRFARLWTRGYDHIFFCNDFFE
jgi:Glycosyltransferase (GlcNAc)